MREGDVVVFQRLTPSDGQSMTPHAAIKPKGLSILDLLRPHWKALTLALLAVAGETATDLAEPWPLKIVLDNLLQSKRLPALDEWSGRLAGDG